MKTQSFYMKAIRAIYNNSIGDRFRARLGFRPPHFIRPLSRREAVSDLFLWRVDKNWETSYDLMNLPSLILPEEDLTDTVKLVFFDLNGSEISRRIIKLKQYQNKRISIRECLGKSEGVGTFACFHSSSRLKEIYKAKCHLLDIHYVSYSKRNDAFRNYAHGNIYGVSNDPEKEKINSLLCVFPKTQVYRPQIRFDDSDRFELAYANASGKEIEILVRAFNDKLEEVERRIKLVPPFGIRVFEFENSSHNLAFVENQSQIGLWRPIIFKYYQSFFDVLHG